VAQNGNRGRAKQDTFDATRGRSINDCLWNDFR